MEDLDSCREALAVLEKMDLADIDSIEGIRTKFEPLVSQFQAVKNQHESGLSVCAFLTARRGILLESLDIHHS